MVTKSGDLIQSNTETQEPTVAIKINGIKGHVDADSCTTSNIMDERRFELVQRKAKDKLLLVISGTIVRQVQG